MTFRAAGTSLSGQSISDGLLVEVARHWRDAAGGGGRQEDPRAAGRDRRATPISCSHPMAYKIGPDPASIATCTMGGILSNNSSGMCCGVEQNAYHTLHR